MSADGHRERMEAARERARELAQAAFQSAWPELGSRLLREAADELDRAEAERVALERVERAEAKSSRT